MGQLNNITIHVDGGSRGNPGPSALGVVVQMKDERGRRKEKEYGEFLGTRTNNEAEYEAIIFALKKVKALIGKEKAAKAHIVIHADSELICSQLRGEFKIMKKVFYPLFIEVWNIKQDFKEVAFNTIPREKNKVADRLVNEALDRELYTKRLF